MTAATAPEAALGFDVGTTSVKAGLLWLERDRPMDVVSVPYPTARPRPGWAEQEPADWIDGMARCWAELQRSLGPLELRSVGICTQVNTHVFVDANLVPLQPAITWQDLRAAGEAATLAARVADRRTELWGGPFSVDASFSLSRLAWLEGHRPAQRAAARWLLQPKDYCIASLTGEIVTDPLSPVGLVGPDGRYLDGVLDLVEGAAALLPPVRPFDSAAGQVRSGDRVGLPHGVPVAVGTMDAWGSILGAGLVQSGRGLDLAGTSEVVAVASETVRPTPGIVSFPPVRGLRVHAGPTQAGGAALAWVASLLSLTVADALDAAARAAGDPQPIVFLPHLGGERAPYWDPDARGVFLGLTTSTTPGHLVLAVLEGVAFAVRMLLLACEQAAELEIERLRVCGGAARSRLWNQRKATAVGRPLDVLEAIDAGVLGAALLGVVAAGLADDVGALAEERVRVARSIEPEPAAAVRLEDLYGVYAESYRALEPLFPRLAAGDEV